MERNRKARKGLGAAWIIQGLLIAALSAGAGTASAGIILTPHFGAMHRPGSVSPIGTIPNDRLSGGEGAAGGNPPSPPILPPHPTIYSPPGISSLGDTDTRPGIEENVLYTNDGGSTDGNVVSVSEPGTLPLVSIGLAGLLLVGLRRRVLRCNVSR